MRTVFFDAFCILYGTFFPGPFPFFEGENIETSFMHVCVLVCMYTIWFYCNWIQVSVWFIMLKLKFLPNYIFAMILHIRCLLLELCYSQVRLSISEGFFSINIIYMFCPLDSVQICKSNLKPLYLAALLQDIGGEKSIVFTSSVQSTHRLSTLLNSFDGLPFKISEYSGLQRQSVRR